MIKKQQVLNILHQLLDLSNECTDEDRQPTAQEALQGAIDAVKGLVPDQVQSATLRPLRCPQPLPAQPPSQG